MNHVERPQKMTAFMSLAALAVLPFNALAMPVTLGTAIAATAIATAPSAQAATRQIPASTVAGVVNAGLSNGKIRLNSFGPPEGNSWHVENDSYVNFLGFQQNFNIPEVSRKFHGRTYAYNVKNINSQNIRIEPRGDVFELTIDFQTDGSAIKGMCRGPKGVRKCVIGKDKAAPDVHWNNPYLKVSLVPQAYNGGLVLKANEVTVGGEFNVGGVCKLLGQGFCNRVLGHRQAIRNGLEQAVFSIFNDSGVNTVMARRTQQGLSSLGIGAVRNVRMSGNIVTVTY